MYWETVGTLSGVPALWVHGGPGSPPSAASRRYFDPMRYRAVIFDQRGCGRSLPLASEPETDLTTNTTDHLVADMERLRVHLGIERWVVFGGSWGSTLALVYAQRHPDRILGVVLGAVSAGTVRETRWITRDMGRVFPEAWERFAAAIPEAERDGDLAAAYARRLMHADPAVRDDAVRRWCEWEEVHVSLASDGRPVASKLDRDPGWQVVLARLVTHYWAHGCFLADGEILAGMDRLAGIPAVLIHGRRDISSPLDTAWAIHRAWPGSRLVVCEDAGHFGGSMDGAVIDALDEMALLVSGGPSER